MKTLWLILFLFFQASIGVSQSIAVEQVSEDLEKPFYFPDTFVAQSAGYLGALSLGVGYQVNPVFGFDIAFGYTPKNIAGRPIRNISFKNTFDLMAWLNEEPTPWSMQIGLGGLYGIDRDLFVVLPEQYSPFYYQPTALRGLVYGSVAYTFPSQIQTYFEMSFHDSEIAGYFRSPYDNPKDLGSYGIGVRWPFLR